MANQLDIFSEGNDLVPSKAGRCVPFGKYKDQPVEVILSDPQYALWLMGSMLDKLQHQYPEFLAFLVSRFGMPDRTPAHNQMQNRFLDESFALRFALACCPKVRDFVSAVAAIDVPAVWLAFVKESLAASAKEPNLTEFQRKYSKIPSAQERLAASREALAYATSRIEVSGTLEEGLEGGALRNLCEVYGMQFEHDGADVAFQVGGGFAVMARLRSEDPMFSGERSVPLLRSGAQESLRVEVKPIVGDDYPAILRSMKAVKDRQLLVGEYVGTGATWVQLVQVFGLSGIQAVLLDDVERVPIPASLDGVPVIPLSEMQAVALLDQAYTEALATLPTQPLQSKRRPP